MKVMTMVSEIAKMYKAVFEKHCWNHPDYALPTLHLIIGQLPEVKKIKAYYQSETHYIDLRFHFCYISPTGTGKGAGTNFVNTMCNLVGLNMQTVTTATDAGLIGKPERVTAYNPKTKAMETNIVLDKGLLHPDKGVNILLYPEAGVLFRQHLSPFVQDQCNYFQIVMNPLGSPDNKLVKRLAIDYTVEFNPNCSLFFTTYEPEGLFSTLINRGLLQRMYFIVNQVDDSTRAEMVKASILNITDPESAEIRKELELQRQELAEKIKKVNEHAKNIHEMKRNPQVIEGFKTLVDMMIEGVKDCQPLIKEQMFKFIQRYFEISYKVAVHHALLRFDTEITQEDVVYAKEIMMASWRRLQALMETRYMPDNFAVRRLIMHDKIIIDKIEERQKENQKQGQDGVSFAELREIIQGTFGYSAIATANYIRQLEVQGYIKRSEENPQLYQTTGKKIILK